MDTKSLNRLRIQPELDDCTGTELWPNDCIAWVLIDVRRYRAYGCEALTNRTSARSLTEHLRVQSPGRMYSRRHLKLSQSLSQVRSTRAFSRADLIPYLNVSRSYVVAAKSNQSPIAVQSDVFDQQSKIHHRR